MLRLGLSSNFRRFGVTFVIGLVKDRQLSAGLQCHTNQGAHRHLEVCIVNFTSLTSDISLSVFWKKQDL